MQFDGNIISRNETISRMAETIASPDLATLSIVAAIAISAILATIAARRF